MNDELIKYLLAMGQMNPEAAQLGRQQAMVDALRARSMTAPEGQMVGKHYVAPHWTNHLANVASGYMANRKQKDVDTKSQEMNDRQRKLLEGLMAPKTPKPIPGAATPGIAPPRPDEDEDDFYLTLR